MLISLCVVLGFSLVLSGISSETDNHIHQVEKQNGFSLVLSGISSETSASISSSRIDSSFSLVLSGISSETKYRVAEFEAQKVSV